ncbi:ty3-gypsy retrotransposon protein [Cucumis melo var. makuwa]|uniref:Ty3-gypsy retrotransposon protein n=1 Tax=Cucumis melo var. makuwa TaxID=1194695 RepID=A0A5A7SNN6_CUCMM|nr:ty3-gypsy retrotransposon protein [Cucumis melo var. makuwa]TYK04474.1 ty3-gypsy retrotransposon protein [Cucumis melo var. makuwa]
MTTNKAASKSYVASDSYTGLVTQSHLKGSMKEQEQGSVLKKKSLEQLIEYPKGGIIIKYNPLLNNSMPASNLSDKESHLEVVFVMMQFDGKDNPKQHIAHFVETCENAGSRDQLVRKFVRSLKGNAFEWYIDLEPEVIDSWEQLKIEFLNCFYSTRRVVSMMKLKNTKQRKGESVIDYINRWRALSLDCKDKLTELFAVEMCTQGMH